MFTITAAEPINRDADAIRVTPEQVWRGLQMRARNLDERFVPPGHRFEVIDDDGDVITRRVALDGRPEELQRVSFHGGRVVVFDFVEGGQRSVILNAIESDDDGEGQLRFTYLIEFTDIEHGSDAERRAADERRPAMAGQPARVMKVIRALVEEGRIA